jgi:hypothetical protein
MLGVLFVARTGVVSSHEPASSRMGRRGVMKKSVIAFLVLMLLPLAASADKPIMMKIKPHAPGCMTPELLAQFLKAIKDNDQKTGEGLLKAGCVMLSPDIQEVELLNVTNDGLEIKVTKGATSLVMWIPMAYDAD